MSRFIRVFIIASVLCSMSCLRPEVELADQWRASLSTAPAGTLVYEGTVYVAGADDAPPFRYQRWVDRAREGSWTSTHVTTRGGGASVVVAQRARHSEAYELEYFEEVHGQTGVVSSVEVGEDGSLEFVRWRGGEREVRTESGGELDVVVGPTLFGYVLEHWEELEGGARLEVRFAVTERARSYVFALEVSEREATRMVIEMTVVSPWLRLAVPTGVLVFERPSRALISYQGSVPPRLEGGGSFEGLVRYDMRAPRLY